MSDVAAAVAAAWSAHAEAALDIVMQHGLSHFKDIVTLARVTKQLHHRATTDMTVWWKTACRMAKPTPRPPLKDGWTRVVHEEDNPLLDIYHYGSDTYTTQYLPKDAIDWVTFDMMSGGIGLARHNPSGAKVTKGMANKLFFLNASHVHDLPFTEYRTRSGRLAHLYSPKDLVALAWGRLIGTDPRFQTFSKASGVSKKPHMLNRGVKKHIFADLQGACYAEARYRRQCNANIKAIITLMQVTAAARPPRAADRPNPRPPADTRHVLLPQIFDAAAFQKLLAFIALRQEHLFVDPPQ